MTRLYAATFCGCLLAVISLLAGRFGYTPPPPSACPAKAATRGFVSRIFRAIRMSFRANGFADISCRCTSAAKNVHSVGHDLQVVWAHTGPISTEVVSYPIIRDWPISLGVRPHMCPYGFLLADPDIDRNYPVAIMPKASPKPAGTKFRTMCRDWSILINLFPKAFFGIACRLASLTSASTVTTYKSSCLSVGELGRFAATALAEMPRVSADKSGRIPARLADIPMPTPGVEAHFKLGEGLLYTAMEALVCSKIRLHRVLLILGVTPRQVTLRGVLSCLNYSALATF